MQEPLLEEYSVAAQIYKVIFTKRSCEKKNLTDASLCSSSLLPVRPHVQLRRDLRLTSESAPMVTDMCELARNSCLQSGFEMEVKRHWLGPNWFLPGVEGNEIHKSNVPDLRVEYRQQTLLEERTMVRHSCSFHRAAAEPCSLSLRRCQVSRTAKPSPIVAAVPAQGMSFGGASGSADVVGAAAMSSAPPLWVPFDAVDSGPAC